MDFLRIKYSVGIFSHQVHISKVIHSPKSSLTERLVSHNLSRYIHHLIVSLKSPHMFLHSNVCARNLTQKQLPIYKCQSLQPVFLERNILNQSGASKIHKQAGDAELDQTPSGKDGAAGCSLWPTHRHSALIGFLRVAKLWVMLRTSY